MIVNLQKGVKDAIVLNNEDMRLIQGGAAAASFPCTVVEADGSVRTTEVSTIEDCLAFAGMN